MLACAVCAAAAAQPAAGPKTATIEAAREIIAAAAADDVFEPLEPSETVRVRHRASGFICWFDPNGTRASVNVQPNLNVPRGDHVQCGQALTDGSRYFFTIKSPPPLPTIEDEAAERARAIEMRYPDAALLGSGSAASASIDGKPLPASAHRRYIVMENGAPRFSSVSVAHIGRWTLAMRYTSEVKTLEDAPLGGIPASLIWIGALLQFEQANSPMP
jgi:hypothetical protein